MIITLSRPGGLPHTTIRTKTRYRAGDIAPIAEGSSFEILRGDLCGAATLKVSGPPPLLRAQDWAAVYLDGDLCAPGTPDDAPRYRGEVVGELWEAGAGDISCQSLYERVRKAAWEGPMVNGKVQRLDASLRPYLLDVLARASLGPVTVGDVPDVPVRVFSVNPFETLATTFDALMPALPGGVVGVDARAQLQVREDDDTVYLRFPQTRSERPPGRVDGYANCVRFRYTKPNGDEAVFRLRLTLEIAVYGQEAWTEESLPASVTSVAYNPYAAQQQSVRLTLAHPGNAAWHPLQFVARAATSPDWTGRLGDGVDLSVLWGPALQMQTINDSDVRFSSLPGELWVTPVPEGVGLEWATPSGTVTPAYLYAAEGGWQAVGLTNLPAGTDTLRYVAADLNAYRAAKGTLPTAFWVRAGQGGEGVTLTARVARTGTGQGAAVTVPAGAQVFENGRPRFYFTPAALTLGTGASFSFPVSYQWRGGDTVTTSPAVTAVSAELNTNPPTLLALERADDVDGRRVWVVPRDYELSGLSLSGDPGQIGWTGINLADEAGLATYGFGLLRQRVQPARSWKGTVRGFALPGGLPIRINGRARFNVPGNDVELPPQRGTYDLGAKTVTVECGTPSATDDGVALVGAIRHVERAVVKAGT